MVVAENAVLLPGQPSRDPTQESGQPPQPPSAQLGLVRLEARNAPVDVETTAGGAENVALASTCAVSRSGQVEGPLDGSFFPRYRFSRFTGAWQYLLQQTIPFSLDGHLTGRITVGAGTCASGRTFRSGSSSSRCGCSHRCS